MMKILGTLIFLFLSALTASVVSAEEGRNSCITTTFEGPEYASIIYRNKCSETITAKVCSKFLVSELWNALNGRSGRWTCSGVNPVVPSSTIDIRITAVEQSSLARKALAETSYRVFTCKYPLKPVIKNTTEGEYDCILDPADRAPKWDDSEFDRLTATKLLAHDDETILGYAPVPVDCSPDISHEIAGIYPDKPMTPLDVITEMRRVHQGVSQSRSNSRCYLSGSDGPLVKFQFHGFIGRKKIFIVNYSTRHFYEFPDYEGLEGKIESILQKSGYLADECSEEYVNKTMGIFPGEKSFSVDAVVESIRNSHRNSILTNRFRKCFAADKYRFPATFQFQLLGDFPIKVVFEMGYQTTGLQNPPDFDDLRPLIREALEKEGRLKE